MCQGLEQKSAVTLCYLAPIFIHSSLLFLLFATPALDILMYQLVKYVKGRHPPVMSQHKGKNKNEERENKAIIMLSHKPNP